MCTQTYLHCTTCNQTLPDTLTTCPTHCTARNPSFRRSVDIHVVQCRVCILQATPPSPSFMVTSTSAPIPTPTTTGKRFEAPPLTVLRRVEKRVWTPLVRRKVAQARPVPVPAAGAGGVPVPAAGTAGKGNSKGRGTARKTIDGGKAKVAQLVPVSRSRPGGPVGGAAAAAAAQAAVRGWRCLASGYRVCKY